MKWVGEGFVKVLEAREPIHKNIKWTKKVSDERDNCGSFSLLLSPPVFLSAFYVSAFYSSLHLFFSPSYDFFSHPSEIFPLFFAEDGSSFSSLIMPNSAPICHVYSAGTKQKRGRRRWRRVNRGFAHYTPRTLYHLYHPLPLPNHYTDHPRPSPSTRTCTRNKWKVGLRQKKCSYATVHTRHTLTRPSCPHIFKLRFPVRSTKARI